MGGSDRQRALGLLSDSALTGLSRAGDRLAYGELVRRHMPQVIAFLRRLGADHVLADDLTQDTFIAALSGLQVYRGEAPFGAWLRTICARILFKRRRKDMRLVLTAQPLEPDISPLSDLAEKLDLEAALCALSPAERLCVSLNHGAGFSHADIAAELDIPVGTVKSHIARGMARLRRHLEKPDDRP